MKKILFFLLVGLALTSNAQNDVILRINHKLDLETFALDAVAQNNLGNSFKATRLEYYISKFTIIHDGGVETIIPLDIIALVRPAEEEFTLIELGNYEIGEVERVKFHIGVYEPVNNGDPTLFPADHPLAPQVPSMHWGWTDGYRFVAYEGMAGAGLDQGFEFHGLGNANYFSQEQEVVTEILGDIMLLKLDANYTEALRDIDLTGGAISHGSTGMAKKVLENFRDYVFGNYYASIEKEVANLDWSIFPNPTTTNAVTIKVAGNTGEQYTIKLTNTAGQLINTILINENQPMSIEIPVAGMYTVSIYKKEELISTDRLIVQ
jgi:hypothetical protein